MRRQIERKWLLAVILVVVLAFALLIGGCAPVQEVKRAAEANKEAVKPAPFAKRLSGGLYLFEYEGHTYFWELDGFILHVVSCKGDHDNSTGPYIRTGR